MLIHPSPSVERLAKGVGGKSIAAKSMKRTSVASKSVSLHDQILTERVAMLEEKLQQEVISKGEGTVARRFMCWELEGLAQLCLA